MVRHHMPREHAEPARAYLAAFLDEAEAADAMHEVAADTTYWGDQTAVAVMAVAHGVLLSRARVAPDAAAAWLMDELGLSAAEAEAITQAPVHRGDMQQPPDGPRAAPPVPTIVEVAADDAPRPVDASRPEFVPRPVDLPPTPANPLKIGFEDPPPPILYEEPLVPRTRLVAGALVIAGLVLLALFLLTR